MSIQIRTARPGDEAEIHESHMRSIREVCVIDHGEDEIRGWGYRDLEERWQEEIRNGCIWVVEDDKIRGFGYLCFFSDVSQIHAYLHALYLTPEVIGKGLGRKLIEIMINQARDRGAKSIQLESSITAHKFYQSQGFKDRGPKQKIEIAGYPVTWFPMILIL